MVCDSIGDISAVVTGTVVVVHMEHCLPESVSTGSDPRYLDVIQTYRAHVTAVKIVCRLVVSSGDCGAAANSPRMVMSGGVGNAANMTHTFRLFRQNNARYKLPRNNSIWVIQALFRGVC